MMHLQLTPKIVAGVALSIGALSAQVVALRILLEETSEITAQREFLASVIAKHDDMLDDFDLMAIRELGIGIRSIES